MTSRVGTMRATVPVAVSRAENVESVVSSRSPLDVVTVPAAGIACPPPPEHAAKIAAAESSARSRACTKMSLHTRAPRLRKRQGSVRKPLWFLNVRRALGAARPCTFDKRRGELSSNGHMDRGVEVGLGPNHRGLAVASAEK